MPDDDKKPHDDPEAEVADEPVKSLTDIEEPAIEELDDEEEIDDEMMK